MNVLLSLRSRVTQLLILMLMSGISLVYGFDSLNEFSILDGVFVLVPTVLIVFFNILSIFGMIYSEERRLRIISILSYLFSLYLLVLVMLITIF